MHRRQYRIARMTEDLSGKYVQVWMNMETANANPANDERESYLPLHIPKSIERDLVWFPGRKIIIGFDNA